MDWFVATLRQYPEIALFLSIGVGYWVGTKSFKGFSLGAVTATLLAAIAIGQLGIKISPDVKSTFFLIFLFAIGYGVGPQFVRGITKDGIPQAIFAAIVCVFCLGASVIVAKVAGYDPGAAAGLFAGSQTISASMGLATDAINRLGLPADQTKAYPRPDADGVRHNVHLRNGRVGDRPGTARTATAAASTCVKRAKSTKMRMAANAPSGPWRCVAGVSSAGLSDRSRLAGRRKERQRGGGDVPEQSRMYVLAVRRGGTDPSRPPATSSWRPATSPPSSGRGQKSSSSWGAPAKRSTIPNSFRQRSRASTSTSRAKKSTARRSRSSASAREPGRLPARDQARYHRDADSHPRGHEALSRRRRLAGRTNAGHVGRRQGARRHRSAQPTLPTSPSLDWRSPSAR